MSSKKRTAATKEDGEFTLVPKLRFPDFRQARGWESKRLGLALKFQAGFPFPSSGFNDEGRGIRLIRNRDLRSDDILKFYSEDFDPNFVVRNGDVLVGMDGDFTPTVWEKGEGLLNQRVGRILPREDNDRYFLLYLLTLCLRDIEESTARTTVKHLSHSAIEDRNEPLPSPSEQQKIAECLSSIDEVISAQARKLDTLKIHKKGLMQQLFPREGETQPRLRFPEFQNAPVWEMMPLSKLVASLDAGVSVNSGDRHATTGEIGVLKTSAVTNGVFDPQENKVVFDDAEIGRVKEPVQANTIIISRMNTPALVGANAYVEEDLENIFLPDRLWAAKPNPGTSMRFVAFILGATKGRAALSRLAKGSSGSMKNISKPEVLAFSLTAPSPAEQHSIASCLSSLDDLIAVEGQKLEALKTHKRGLMQQLFPSAEEAK
jgi:type I restriction enzyme S subunit